MQLFYMPPKWLAKGFEAGGEKEFLSEKKNKLEVYYRDHEMGPIFFWLW